MLVPIRGAVLVSSHWGNGLRTASGSGWGVAVLGWLGCQLLFVRARRAILLSGAAAWPGERPLAS